jgi:hypothetical protein
MSNNQGTQSAINSNDDSVRMLRDNTIITDRSLPTIKEAPEKKSTYRYIGLLTDYLCHVRGGYAQKAQECARAVSTSADWISAREKAQHAAETAKVVAAGSQWLLGEVQTGQC